jgi:hypothetical protein
MSSFPVRRHVVSPNQPKQATPTLEEARLPEAPAARLQRNLQKALSVTNEMHLARPLRRFEETPSQRVIAIANGISDGTASYRDLDTANELLADLTSLDEQNKASGQLTNHRALGLAISHGVYQMINERGIVQSILGTWFEHGDRG